MIAACTTSKKEIEIYYDDCRINFVVGNWYCIDVSGRDLYSNPFETDGPFDLLKILKIERKRNRIPTFMAVYFEKRYKERPKEISAIDTSNYLSIDTVNLAINMSVFLSPVDFISE